MSSESLIAHLKSFDMDQLRSNLNEAPEPTSGPSKSTIINDAIAWIEGLRADVISLISNIDNQEDVEMAIAIQYVELKSRWIAFNTKINYATFRTGNPSISDMCRAASVSAFLGHIEPLLKPSDIDNITGFLAQPLSQAA